MAAVPATSGSPTANVLAATIVDPVRLTTHTVRVFDPGTQQATYAVDSGAQLPLVGDVFTVDDGRLVVHVIDGGQAAGGVLSVHLNPAAAGADRASGAAVRDGVLVLAPPRERPATPASPVIVDLHA